MMQSRSIRMWDASNGRRVLARRRVAAECVAAGRPLVSRVPRQWPRRLRMRQRVEEAAVDAVVRKRRAAWVNLALVRRRSARDAVVASALQAAPDAVGPAVRVDAVAAAGVVPAGVD